MVPPVLIRHRAALTLVLACAAVAAAPAAAHDGGHCYPVWWHHHWVCAGPATAPTSSAPASTSAPATTDPAATSDPAPADTAVADPVPTVLPSVSPTASSATVSDPAPTAAAPPPVLGKSVAAAATAGTVVIRTPDGKSAVLSSASALPTGTRIDTRVGEIALTSAIDADGTTQTGRFSGGVFEVRQTRDGHGLTQIVMVGGHWAACASPTSGYAARAAKKKARKPIRKLWGSDDHGRFQTQGGGSVATVRGTHWLTTDTCDGTRTTVLAGAVEVKSRKTGKATLVHAGETIFVDR